MGDVRDPEQLANNFLAVDISAGMTTLPATTVEVSFRVTTAGTLSFKGVAKGAPTVERELDTGTYTIKGRFAQVGPGTTAVIAVLDPADEIVVGYTSALA